MDEVSALNGPKILMIYGLSVFTRLKYDLQVETWRGEHENAPKMLFEASRYGPHVPLL